MPFATLLALVATTSVSLGASASQMVRCDHTTRFTVLTPMVIRAEYSQQGTFEDKPTQVFLFRDKAQALAPTFKVYTRVQMIFIKYNISMSTYAPVVTSTLCAPPRCRTRQRGATSRHPNSCYHIISRAPPPRRHRTVCFRL